METLTQFETLVSTNPFSENVLLERLAYLEARASEMEESIRYAGSLQRSILPNERVFKNCFKDAFVLFEPKDVVSGDFYWIYQHQDEVYFAVGDCTGHGVPGALVNIAQTGATTTQALPSLTVSTTATTHANAGIASFTGDAMTIGNAVAISADGLTISFLTKNNNGAITYGK